MYGKDRPPAQHPRRPAGRGAEVRHGGRARAKGLPDSQLSYSLAEVEALDYKDLAADGEPLLNLQALRFLGKFLGASAGSPPK